MNMYMKYKIWNEIEIEVFEENKWEFFLKKAPLYVQSDGPLCLWVRLSLEKVVKSV
jgi:hypothetical protein